MGHEFETVDELHVDATPDQVWDAVATGPGIDSWFMGRNDVDPGQTIRTAFGDYTPEHPVTAWEPGHRLAYGTDRVAYEFLIEGRDRGSTVLRITAAGFLPGDDWADEYDAMTKGHAMFFHTLATYLDHFAGRTATPVTAFGPSITDWPRTRGRLMTAIGRDGDRVRFAPKGLPGIDGTVYFENDDTVGIRTDDALYRFLRGFRGPVMACHHIFGETTGTTETTEQAWQAWLNTEDLT
ncbi:SRPBCC domain-containing protein [Actinophytocola sp.]|uniref:SRPBCC family protein n=1 Tax=Actinophytocola sp. TaxID=1872138 RepID=UPI002D35D271|nr:SRPBCC domain-containing protein [Actinophytocola sp.]HYQ62805.1 SRPBCC domain-containing protein [Actinophytocola sp.]